jgi:transposase-like protein
MDGKSFDKDQMVVALGITLEGKKIFLGFVQTATENGRSVGLFLESLLARGLNIEQGILAVTDGSKGLIKALREVFAKRWSFNAANGTSEKILSVTYQNKTKPR